MSKSLGQVLADALWRDLRRDFAPEDVQAAAEAVLKAAQNMTVREIHAEDAVIEAAKAHRRREDSTTTVRGECSCGGWSTDWDIYYAVESLEVSDD